MGVVRRTTAHTPLWSVLALLASFEHVAAVADADRALRHLQERSCPIFAERGLPDTVGDCQCAADKPYCFQDGRQQCYRIDGRLDLHYFSAACTTCECRMSQDSNAVGSESGTETSSEPTCQSAGGSEGITKPPDAAGLCYCTADKPLCVNILGSQEQEGCLGENSWAPSKSSVDGTVSEAPLASDDLSRAFHAGCPANRCSCRAMCPSYALKRYADGLSDCSCSTALPTCVHVDGGQCESSSESSTSYFKASCGTNCECHPHFDGLCDAKQCLKESDCSFQACRDCKLCAGISRCPSAPGDDEIQIPDGSGNCKCRSGEQCYEGKKKTPGCPVAPAGSSQVMFQVSCLDCACNTSIDMANANLKCPKFAKENLPGFSGDCVCPDHLPDCYKAGIRWCARSTGQRDLHFFDPGCLDCECRESQNSSTEEDDSAQRFCPPFAKFMQADVHKNCACPAHRPVCVEQGGTQAPDRAGPLCKTSQGWDSVTEFRYDCTQCSCQGVEGEGELLREFDPDELLDVNGDVYVRMQVVVDLRFVNTRNTLGDWKDMEDAVLFSDSGWQVFAAAAALGFSGPHAEAVGHISDLSPVDSKDFPSDDFEDVRVHRVFAKLGVMWAQTWSPSSESGDDARLLRGRRPEAEGPESHGNVSSRRLQDEGKAKAIEDLTLHEKEYLLHLGTVYRPGYFKAVVDFELQKLLNDTDAWGQTGALMEAPRVSVSRADFLANGESDISTLPELTLEGPLEPTAPFLQNLKVVVEEEQEEATDEADSGAEQDEEFDFLSLLPFAIGGGAGIGGIAVLYFLIRALLRCRRLRLEAADEAARAAAVAKDPMSQVAVAAAVAGRQATPAGAVSEPEKTQVKKDKVGRGSVIHKNFNHDDQPVVMNLAMRQKLNVKSTSAAANAVLAELTRDPTERAGGGINFTNAKKQGGGFFSRRRKGQQEEKEGDVAI